MAPTLDDLGKMAPGGLIRSDDWNALVSAVQGIDNDLTKKINDLDTRLTSQVQALQASLTSLTSAFQAFQTDAEKVIDEFFRVSLTSTQSVYAIGQLAELTIQVADPRAHPIKGTAEPGLPWVDVVTTWGRLRAAPGFESLAGDGDRAMSVRVTADGVAKVLLASDHVENFTDQDEQTVNQALQSPVASANKPLSQVILDAKSPVEVKATTAFQMVSTEYERTDTTAMRRYLDTYYVRNAPWVVGKYVPPRPALWRDYRATVLAFARSDGDPASPTRRHGADSLLVTFRDWIIHWINLGYLADDTIGSLVQQFTGTVGSKIVAGRSYADAARTLQQTVTDAVSDPGLIGSMRKYKAMDQALNQVTVSNPPSYLPDLTGALREAVRMQHTLEQVQTEAAGVPDEKVAFQALSDATTRADVNVSDVTTQLDTLQQQLQQANQSVTQVSTTITSLQTSMSAVNGRLDGITSEGGALTGLRADVNTVKGQIAGFQQLNPTDVSTRLAQITGLSNRLTAIEQKVG